MREEAQGKAIVEVLEMVLDGKADAAATDTQEAPFWAAKAPTLEIWGPFTRDQMIATFKGLPEAEIAAMLGGNAAEFYGFDTEKLAPIVARIGPEKSAFHSPNR